MSPGDSDYRQVIAPSKLFCEAYIEETCGPFFGEALKLYRSLVYETCPPANIFNTALISDGDNSMELQWPPISLPTSSYYAALYFADMSKGNSRMFDIFINGYTFYHNLEVTSSGLVVFVNNWILSSITRITVRSESDPPIISADEVFVIMTLGGITLSRDGVITNGKVFCKD
ncbi:hypothetical protein KSP40_PGU019678 [Platanthera guangdongensis]|uniref:Malectin-like domain-containing protein n=1 Tax=Platanthera guangdongensis TaxID=2320717 RepID=A0ABR2M8C8_9ASPA